MPEPNYLRAFALILVCFTAFVNNAHSQSTSFTFQGNLSNNSLPAEGNYDFEFRLFDQATNGTQLGPVFAANGVAVAGGSFSVTLDFGDEFPGADRWIEIRVRQAALPSARDDLGGFTILTPRQKINPVPYSIRSSSAASADTAATADFATSAGNASTADSATTAGSASTADSATTAATATNALQLGGVAAAQYVVTTDPRLSDARPPTAGSGDYVQNSTTLQPSSNFNISGTGKAAVFDAGSQFNIGGTKILSNAGTKNLIAGEGAGGGDPSTENAIFGYMAGAAPAAGGFNSFFGTNAGTQTVGGSNAFFGRSAGFSNTQGNWNSFFGDMAGSQNTIGFYNSFFGQSSGSAVGGGNNNTLMGAKTVVLNSVSYATAIGAEATVGTSNTIVLGRSGGEDTVLIPGPLYTTGNIRTAASFIIGGNVVLSTSGTNNLFTGPGAGASNTTGADNTFIGPNAGNKNTSGMSNTFTGVRAGRENSIGQSNSFYGFEAGVNNTSGSANSFFGVGAGASSTSSETNSFFGYFTGNSITSGLVNSFFGARAGESTTTGSRNAYFGVASGQFGVTGSNNAFYGYLSGRVSTANNNSYFGSEAGAANVDGSANAYFGYLAGAVGTTGSSNSFFGSAAGINTTGSSNTFVGRSSGDSNTTGGLNTLLGFQTDTGTNGLTNATAIGAMASVTQNDSLVLGSIAGVNGAGSSVNVGIGTTAPRNRLEVGGAILVTGPRISFLGSGMTLSSEGTFDLVQSFNNRPLILNGSGNRVGINETNPQDQLDVNGRIRVSSLGSAGATTLCRNASNQISTCSSSIRYKNNIEDFSSGLDILRRLRPVTFNWKDSGALDLGLVAEEVAEIEPLLVTYNANGVVEGVKYDRIGVVLVNVVKEQQKTIEVQGSKLKVQGEELKRQKEKVTRQNERIEELEKRLSTQGDQIEALKTLVCASNPTAAVCQ